MGDRFSRGRATVAIGLVGLLAAATAARATTEVEARITPKLIGVGQFVSLTLEARVDGGLDLSIEPHFSLDNLEIVAGPSQSQQVSFINGRVSRSQSLTWTLRAIAVGTARVQGLRLSVNEEIFELPEQVVEVQIEPVDQIDHNGRTRRPPAPFDPFEDFFDPMKRRRQALAAPEPKLFLRAEASPRDPYVGQQVLYSLVLFTQADIGAVSPDAMPDFEGLWSIDIEQPRRPKSVMTEIQGERYGKVVLLQKALFPLRSGELRLDPVEARLVARIPDYSWLGVVGTYDKEYSLASNAITLDVRPIPDGGPEFSGAVGQFELSATLEPDEIDVGDAATLTVELSGRGHVEGLPEPQLPTLEGLEIFPPQPSGGDRAVGTTVHGRKSWSFVLVPERAGVWEIELPQISYFDPVAGEHRTTAAQPRLLVARDIPTPPAAESPDEAPMTAGPARDAGPLIGTGEWTNWWPVGAALLAVALAVPLIKRVMGRHAATRHLRQHLQSAARLDKPRASAQAIEQAWRSFLLERWSLSPTLAPGEWAAALSERGLPEPVLGDLSGLVDDLHYLRYAPELSDYESLRAELVERSLRLARALG